MSTMHSSGVSKGKPKENTRARSRLQSNQVRKYSCQPDGQILVPWIFSSAESTEDLPTTTSHFSTTTSRTQKKYCQIKVNCKNNQFSLHFCKVVLIMFRPVSMKITKNTGNRKQRNKKSIIISTLNRSLIWMMVTKCSLVWKKSGLQGKLFQKMEIPGLT